MARRFMGKLAFMSLVDDSGSIQVYLDKAVLDAAEADTFKCAIACFSHLLQIIPPVPWRSGIKLYQCSKECSVYAV